MANFPGQHIGQQAFVRTSAADTNEPHGYAKSLYPCSAKGPYGIRTRAAAVRGRCPRPLDEWAVAKAECSARCLGERPRRRTSGGTIRRWRAARARGSDRARGRRSAPRSADGSRHRALRFLSAHEYRSRSRFIPKSVRIAGVLASVGNFSDGGLVSHPRPIGRSPSTRTVSTLAGDSKE